MYLSTLKSRGRGRLRRTLRTGGLGVCRLGSRGGRGTLVRLRRGRGEGMITLLGEGFLREFEGRGKEEI